MKKSFIRLKFDTRWDSAKECFTKIVLGIETLTLIKN